MNVGLNDIKKNLNSPSKAELNNCELNNNFLLSAHRLLATKRFRQAAKRISASEFFQYMVKREDISVRKVLKGKLISSRQLTKRPLFLLHRTCLISHVL